MAQETREVIDRWHDMMSASAHDGLFELLAEDCIFWSPVVPVSYTHLTLPTNREV